MNHMRFRCRWISLLVLCLLTGCGGGYASYGPATAMTCVPYARSITRLPLDGDAWAWWDEARGRYVESDVPTPGAVLVFRRTGRLPSGHLAVVSAVLSDRRVLVTQANWLPYRITSNQPVLDVSPQNDWTVVRVWWPPVHGWGATVYPTNGFILTIPVSAPPPMAQSMNTGS
ncbi:CHAP domain-containing protein [Acidisoma sp.]|uniref:CHAP domain-containing protein n=1 Tax=Acidisoma sp. TaxID=1872115 RepID=UPI003B00B2E1